MPPFEVFLGLGANEGNPRQQLESASSFLSAKGVRPRARSSFYFTEPVGGPPQPWYVNAVVAALFRGEPRELLDICQSIESLFGRKRGVPMGPRSLDLDILLFGEAILRTPELTLPHDRLHERRFVLVPMVEIAPELRHPVSGLTMRELLGRCPDRSAVTLLTPSSEAARRSYG